jgi:hypothetical protein
MGGLPPQTLPSIPQNVGQVTDSIN